MALNLGLIKGLNSESINNLIKYDNMFDGDDAHPIIYTILLVLVLSVILLWKNSNLIYKTNNNASTNSNSSTNSKSYHTELIDIIDQKEIILDELVSIITMNDTFKQNKTFDLIIGKGTILNNVEICPKTYDMLKNITGLINASFVCLDPHSEKSYYPIEGSLQLIKNMHKIYIPLIIPISVEYNDMVGLNVYGNDNNLIKLKCDTSLQGDLLARSGNLGNTSYCSQNELSPKPLGLGNTSYCEQNEPSAKPKGLGNTPKYFATNNECYHQLYNKTDYHFVTLSLDIEDIENIEDFKHN